jgi:outer membrane protein assembly factor BamB
VKALGAALALLAATGGIDASRSWPQWLGPSRDGTTAAPGAFPRTGQVPLREAWRRPLGAGTGGIVVDDGRVFTLLSDGEDEEVVALAFADGKELWRAQLDPWSSESGPASTPLADGPRVIVLSRACQLRAFDAAKGAILWQRDLKTDFAVVLREGCATSPLIEEGTLVVQGGGRDNDQRLIGLDPASGTTRWTAKGGERTFYSSPVMADIGGVRQVVVHHTIVGPPPRSALMGLRWSDRERLWTHTLGQLSHDTPVALPGGRVLLATWNGADLVRIASSSGAFEAKALWHTDALKTYVSPPVHHEGHLYGFADDFLSCLSADTGAVAWREKLYAGSAILVDGHLVLLSVNSGLLRVAEASPAGYREKGRLKAFNPGARAEAPPSFAGGRIFVRNDEEILAVAVGG